MDLWSTYLDYMALHHGVFSIFAWFATLNVIFWSFCIVLAVIQGIRDIPKNRRADKQQRQELLARLASDMQQAAERRA